MKRETYTKTHGAIIYELMKTVYNKTMHNNLLPIIFYGLIFHISSLFGSKITLEHSVK